VGPAAHNGEGFEAGDSAAADDGAVGRQVTEPAARDTETVEDLVVKVAAARGEQAGGRGDRARPSDAASEAGRAGKARYFGSFPEIEACLAREVQAGDLVLTMGAGDIYRVGEELLNSEKSGNVK